MDFEEETRAQELSEWLERDARRYPHPFEEEETV